MHGFGECNIYIMPSFPVVNAAASKEASNFEVLSLGNVSIQAVAGMGYETAAAASPQKAGTSGFLDNRATAAPGVGKNEGESSAENSGRMLAQLEAQSEHFV